MYSVKEVANRLNISRQAVYKRLNTELYKEYVKVVDEVKYIDEIGFKLLEVSCTKVNRIIEEQVNNQYMDQHSEEEKLTTNKDELIGMLNSMLLSKDKDIEYFKEENKKLLELMQQQNKLLYNSQQIQQKALSNTELILLEKRQQLLIREAEYKLNEKRSLRERIRILFKGR